MEELRGTKPIFCVFNSGIRAFHFENAVFSLYYFVE